MKKTVEISASFSGKISTGSFENESPYFSVKETYELGENSTEKEKADFDNEKFIQSRQKELHDICYQQFKQQADIAYTDRIAKEYQNIRFYDAGAGLKYPSVTSIIGMDDKFFIPEDELAQAGARGTILHKQAEIFLKTGEWKEPKDIAEISFDYLTLVKGNKNLLLDDVNFRGFYKDYPFKVLELEATVINNDLKFGGRYDIKALIESANKSKWDKVEGIIFDTPVLLDLKTSASLDKIKGFTQLSAYAMCDQEIKGIGLIHLNNEVQAGFSKPVFTTNLERYQEIFRNQREQFRKRYGI